MAFASQVGANGMLCGQVGLAGSTRIGDGAILAGQVGTAGHLTIGKGAVITAQSGVPNDVPAAGLYSGYPAVENRQWLKTHAALNRLPPTYRQRRLNPRPRRIAQRCSCRRSLFRLSCRRKSSVAQNPCRVESTARSTTQSSRTGGTDCRNPKENQTFLTPDFVMH